MNFFLVTLFLLLDFSVCFPQSDGREIRIPDKITIGLLENIFEPVHFDHKLHAEMTVMGDGCNTCHHNGAEGVYEPCETCHVNDEQNASLSMPTLNGAYHRNCLNCHQSWYSKELCETCHIQKKRRFNLRKTLDATDVLAHHHQEIIVPKQFHFVTPQSQQAPVVFHHKEHVDLYRFKCEHCHVKMDCSTCHKYSPPTIEEVKTLTVHHNPCSTCHDTQNENGCGLCHNSTPAQGFTHTNTGWELSRFHQDLSCNTCHIGVEPIKALDKTCTACHTNFELGGFDHQVTGIQLSDEHIEIDCYECHVDNRFDVPPSCVECHEEDLAYPTDIPGTRVRQK